RRPISEVWRDAADDVRGAEPTAAISFPRTRPSRVMPRSAASFGTRPKQRPSPNNEAGLLVRHARPAQPAEKRLLRQRLRFRRAVGLQRLKPCDADKAIVAAEPPGLRELNRGARLVALQSIG